MDNGQFVNLRHVFFLHGQALQFGQFSASRCRGVATIYAHTYTVRTCEPPEMTRNIIFNGEKRL